MNAFNTLFCIIILSVPAALAIASEADQPSDSPLEQVTIIGSEVDTSATLGSAQRVGEAQLAIMQASDINRALAAVPGVYFQEEDGFGLRPNIGIRGSGLDRSSRITLLEDGVLIAPAPYSAPSAYYFPTQKRMQGIEVLKGAAAIRQGPRTTGGAVNLLSRTIPEESLLGFNSQFGSDGRSEQHGFYGASTEQVAWLIEGLKLSNDGFKNLPNGADTGYDIEDVMGKLRFNNADDALWQQSIEIKLGWTRQHSDETYLGLSDDDFEADPYQRYAASQNDTFNSIHRGYSATYRLAPLAADWSLALTAYRNEFARNWYKLEGVNGSSTSAVLADVMLFSDEYSWLTGVADSPDDALRLRNNNRAYTSEGLQTSWYMNFGKVIEHNLTVGLRLHRDEEDRFQDQDFYAIRNGQLLLTRDEAPGSQSNRLSSAEVMALYIEDSMRFERWELTVGLRYEDIDMTRLDFATDDPQRTQVDRERNNSISALVPGVGIKRDVTEQWSLIAGVFEGFNPSSPGSTAQEERSLNYELGAVYRSGDWLVKAIGFYNDYENLVATCTVSSGGDCVVGDQFDGAQAKVGGMEFLATAAPFSLGHFNVPFSVNYTYTPIAEFKNSFNSAFSAWGDVLTGDALPYVPEHQWQLSSGIAAGKWRVDGSLRFSDELRTQAGQATIEPGSSIASFAILDISTRYDVNDTFSLFGRIENVTDKEYAVARRPAGLRPGMPRSALLGVSLTL